MSPEKELLRKLGEETLYSAKGHFKACDVRRNLITITIWLCAILNIIALFEMNAIAAKVLAGLALLGTIALLIWNEGEGKFYRARHKELGELYLALHKEIRACYFLAECSKQEVEVLNNKVITLDASQKPDIPGIARRLAKKSIESSDPETDNWFLKE